MEGLLWVYLYYTGVCPDWKWCYGYNYPPLLGNLRNWNGRVPILGNGSKPMTEEEQLAFVLPSEFQYLNPYDTTGCRGGCDTRMPDVPEEPSKEMKIEYAYCTFFWEAHVSEE